MCIRDSIHFINVRYLVQQQRIGEGRATMRVRFVLNTLNNADEDRECEAFLVFQRLNVAIQDAKNHEPALSERCNLTYFDMPLSTNMLQAYWIDYEVWFRESSAWKYRDWVKRYVVMPPFTQQDVYKRQLPNLRKLWKAKDRRGSKMEKEDIIVDVPKRTTGAGEGICNTDTYRR